MRSMEEICIVPLFITENPHLISWLSDSIEAATLFEFTSLHCAPTVAEVELPVESQAVIVFIDLMTVQADELEQETMVALAPWPLVAVVPDTESGLAALAQGLDDYLIPSETDAKLFTRSVRYLVRQQGGDDNGDRSGHEERFQTFLENAPDIIYIFDLVNERITYFNRDQLLGYTAEELQRPGSLLNLIYHEDQGLVRQHLEELSQAAPGDVFVTEYRLQPKEGEWEWVQSRETILTVDESGRATELLASLSVITQRKQREVAVRRYAERLQILHEIDQAIVAARSPQAIAQAALRRISRIVLSRRASVIVFNWEEDTLNILAELPESATGGASDSAPLPLSWYWATDTLRQGEIHRTDDLGSVDEEEKTPLTTWLQNQGLRSIISVPLLAQRQLIGALNFGTEVVNGFSAEDVVVMREVAHVLAIAMAQARLYEQVHYHARKLEQRAKRLLLVNDISLAVNRPIELNAVLEAATKGLGAVIEVRKVGVVLLNESRDTWTLMAGYSTRNGRTLKDVSVPVQDKEMIQQLLQVEPFRMVENVQHDPRFANVRELLVERKFNHLILVPLQVRDEVIGVVGCDIGPGSRPFSREESELIQTIANLLSVKLEQIRLFEETRRQLEELKVLHTLATAGAESRSEDALLEHATELMEDTFFPDNFGVLLLDEAAQTLTTHHSYHSGRYERSTVNIALGEGICGYVAQTGRPLRVPDVSQEPRYREADPQTRSELCVPLRTGNRLLGVVNAESNQLDAFSRSHERLLVTFAHQLATAIEKLRLLQAERKRRREAETASDILRTLNATPNVREAFAGVGASLRDITGCHRVSLALSNESRDAFSLFAVDQLSPHQELNDWYPIEDTTAAEDILAGRVHLTPDLSEEQNGILEQRLHQAGQNSRMNLPLRVGDSVIGSLNLTWREPSGYDEAQVPLLSQIASAVALAVERSRLFAETQTNLAETQALYRVGRSLIAAENLPELLQAVVNSVRRALPADRALLVTVDLQARKILDYMPDSGSQRDLRRSTFEELWEGLAGWVLRNQQPLLLVKGEQDPRESETMRDLREESGYGSVLVVPLHYRDNILGTITAINRREAPDFNDRNLELMVAMANQAAVAIENARLFVETHRRAEELGVLANLSAALRVADGASQIIDTVLASSENLFTADMVAIAVPGPQPDTVVVAHEVGVPEQLKEYVYGLNNSIFGHVFSTGKPYLTTNVIEDPLIHNTSREAWREAGILPRSAIYAPLQAGTRVIGIICVMKTSTELFEEEDLRLLTAMAEIAGSALQRAGLMETLEQRVEERTRELAEANEQLTELDRLKSKFVSDISHELRTPITNLSLYMDLIERGSPERSERYWAVLRKQTDRLNQLIEDILSLSRLQMGKIEMVFTPLDLNELVAEVVSVHREQFADAGLELHFVPDRRLPPIPAQAEQVVQVIANLLKNALSYTAEGQVRVSTFADEDREMVCIAIRDSGVGIAEDDLEHIFERFYRGRYASQSNIPGTGLGLTIVEEIINLHQGRIEVQSEQGVGTTFRVWLPMNIAEENGQ